MLSVFNAAGQVTCFLASLRVLQCVRCLGLLCRSPVCVNSVLRRASGVGAGQGSAGFTTQVLGRGRG